MLHTDDIIENISIVIIDTEVKSRLISRQLLYTLKNYWPYLAKRLNVEDE